MEHTALKGGSGCTAAGRGCAHTPGLVAWDGEAGPHIGVQLQLLAQREVQRPVALADGRCHGPLQAHPVLLRAHCNC